MRARWLLWSCLLGCGGGKGGPQDASVDASVDAPPLPLGECDQRTATPQALVGGMPGLCTDGFCTLAPYGMARLDQVQVVGPDDVWAIYGDTLVHGARDAWVPEPLEVAGTMRALYASAEGVWVGGNFGLYRRGPDGVWAPTEITDAVHAVAGRRGTPDVWALTYETLWHFDGARWSSTSLPDAYFELAIGRDGAVFLGGGNGRVAQFVDGAVVPNHPGGDDPVSTLFATGADDLWAGWLNDFGEAHWDGTRWHERTVVEPRFGAAGIDAVWGRARGDTWWSWGGGFAHWRDGGCDVVTAYAPEQYGPRLDAMDGTPDGSTIYAVGDGLAWFDGAAWQARVDIGPDARTMAMTDDGAIWLALHSARVARLSNGTIDFFATPATNEALAVVGDVVLAAGVSVVQLAATGPVELVPAQPHSFRALYAPSLDELWLVTFDGAIQHWTRQGGLQTPAVGATTKFRAVAGSSATDVYFVGEREGGVSAVHWNGTAFEPVVGLPAADAHDVAVRAPNDAWIVVGAGEGLYHFDGTAWSKLPVAVSGTRLAPDAPGAVWVTGGSATWRATVDGAIERFATPQFAVDIAAGGSGGVVLLDASGVPFRRAL